MIIVEHKWNLIFKLLSSRNLFLKLTYFLLILLAWILLFSYNETYLKTRSRKVFRFENCSGFIFFVINNHFGNPFKISPGWFDRKLLSFVRSIQLFKYSEFYIFIQYVLCILGYFILISKLWDKFLNFMISLIFIIFYILIYYINFELIF